MKLQRPIIDYYCFRTTGFDRFQALDTVYTLYRELTRIPDKSFEPAICRQTLQFWYQDIMNAYEGKAQIPVVLALQATLKHHDLPKLYWEDMITAIEMDIDRILYFNNDDLQRYAIKKRGNLLAYYAIILGNENKCSEILMNMATFIERVEILQHFGKEERFLNYIPEQTRTITSCEIWQLQQAQPHAAACLKAFIEDTKTLLPRDLASLPHPLKPLRVMIMIYSELLDLLSKEPIYVLTQKIDLSPLAKLFYSYYYGIIQTSRKLP